MGKRVLNKFIPGALRFQVHSGHQPSRASFINITSVQVRSRRTMLQSNLIFEGLEIHLIYYFLVYVKFSTLFRV
jgi:hypothetical protein